MSERAKSILYKKLSDTPDAGLSIRGTPQDRIALLATLTAEAWLLAGLSVPAYERAATPVHIRSLREVPPTGAR